MLRGILPVLPTPFDHTGAIDAAGMQRIVDFALESGVAGVVYPGFASEIDDLTADERTRLLRIVVERVAGRVPVVAGASAGRLEDVITHAREAAALGVGTVMVQAPKSLGTDGGAVAGFYRAVAAAVPNLAIVLQNAPAPRGSDLDPVTIVAIARDNPAIRYVKEETLPSGGAISAILAGKPDHVAGVLGGGGARYVVDEYVRGACGAMPAVELADLHVAFDAAFRTGDVKRAREIYARTLPLLVIQAIYRMRLTKEVLVRRGVIDHATVRAKLPEFDDYDRREIDAWLEAIADLLAVRRPSQPATRARA